MTNLIDFLRSNPSLLLFAALAGGYALGKVKVKGFSLGSTTSVLIVGIVLGALIVGKTHYDLGILKTVSFGLFIFGIGYKVGPDFMGGLKRGGINYVLVPVVFAVVAILAAVGISHLFSFNTGYAAGMLGGALTQSAVIGTADTALKHLAGETPTAALNLQSDVAVAYAVTYIFGTAGLIILLKVIAAVWRVDLKKSAKEAEAALGKAQEQESLEAFKWENLVEPHAYRVENTDNAGKTIEELETTVFPRRVAIDRIKKKDVILTDPSSDTPVEKDDVVLLVGFESSILQAGASLGTEVDDTHLRDLVGEILDICITHKDLDGKTVREIVDTHARGCFVRYARRQGQELPFGPQLKLYRGDVIQVMGARDHVEKLVTAIGYPERRSNVTDLVTVGIGIIVGTLLGLIAVPIAGIPLTLGVGGGVLVSGLFFGWLRSLRPTWGRVPSSALWIFTDLGLNLFIACVGISAGPKALDALKTAGVEIFIAGVLLTTIPHLLTWIFGKYVLKMNPVLLLGALTGSGTCTAAMNSIKEDCESTVPVIGYTVPYAIGNVLLTVWGALIVHLV